MTPTRERRIFTDPVDLAHLRTLNDALRPELDAACVRRGFTLNDLIAAQEGDESSPAWGFLHPANTEGRAA